MPNQLLLEYHDIVSDDFTKQPLKSIYALVFDPLTEKAVKFSDPAPYALEDFDGSNSSFCKILSQGTNRTRYYSFQIPSASLNLPDCTDGDEYTIEYWAETASGTQNRNNDTFLGFEKFIWYNDQRATSRINIVQEDSIIDQVVTQVTDFVVANSPLPRYECFCSTSYDPTIERINFCCWLEKDAELQADAKAVTVKLYDVNEVVIAELTSTTITAAGNFMLAADTITLSPDQPYFLTVKITDADDVIHTSASGPTTWD